MRSGACSGTFGPFLGIVGCVSALPVHPGSRGVRSGAFSSFPYPLGFVLVPFSSAMGIVGCDRSIPVCPGVCSGALGPFPCALDVV